VALNSTLAVSAIRDPANSLAIGDANQAFPDGGSWVTFDWQQEGCAAPYAGVGDYLVPPDGFIVGGMANSDWSPTFTFGTGLRYRHNTWSRAGGWGNAVFFDGHATGIPINRNTSGTPANAPGSQGGAGLRIKNIYDPVRAPTVIGS
jgi:prepilin-type processing-associated H-X9-DG protein